MVHLEAGDVIAALIADIKELPVWVESAMTRIISQGRDLADARESAVAADCTNGDRIVKTIGGIEEPAIRRDDHLRSEVGSCKPFR